MPLFNFNKQQTPTTPEKMNVSKSGIEFISKFEGVFRKGTSSKYAPRDAKLASENPSLYYVYIDPVGLPTIGIGHLLTKSELNSGIIVLNGKRVNYKNGLTIDQVNDLKAQDMIRFVEAVRKNVQVPLTQSMFDAIVSWAFNVGAGRVHSTKQTLIRKLNAGDYKGAANEFPKWNKSSGRVLSGLTRRRNAERDMFLSEINKVT